MRREDPDRRNRVARALADPLYFGEMYVRPFDAGWRSALPTFAGEMLAFALAQRRGCVILPPEFLKTTMLSQVLPLWLTFRYTWEGKLLRGMLLSEEEGMAARNLAVVAWHIENNDLLRADFSDGRGRPLVKPDPEEEVWRGDALIVARAGTSKDPTWQAKGLDSKGIQGRRLDWLLGDDVVTPKNAFSAAHRHSALNLWDLQITTRLVRAGHAIIAGNFNHERDLISILAQRKTYGVYRRPALHAPDDPTRPDEDGVPLWEENWPRERLEEERADKPQRFRRIFMLDPRAEMGERLRVDWVTLLEPSETPMGEARFYLGLDPAPGGIGEDLDYFNVTVLALHGAYCDLVASLDIRRDISEQCALVGAVHDRFARLGSGVLAIAGAKQAMDRYMRGALTAIRPDLAPKLLEVAIPGSKMERLEAIGPFARSGWLRVWRTVWEERTADLADQSQELSLNEQWREFPHCRHDDKLDGLDVAIRAAREHIPALDREVALEVL